MKTKLRSYGLFDYFNIVLMLFLGAICVLPLLHVVALSFSSSPAVLSNQVYFWPVEFTTAAYQRAFEDPQLLKSFWVSIKRVCLGVSIGLFVTCMAGYVLSKGGGRDGIAGHKFFIIFFIFALLFNGGLIPTYLLITNMGLYNSIWAIVLPGLTNVFYIILIMNFFSTLPKSLEESAFLDGANHFQVFYKIYLPLSVPVVATVGLFMVVFEWNEFFAGQIYMKADNVPLSTFIKSAITLPDFSTSDPEELQKLNFRSISSAQVVFAALPILALFPVLQKFFTRGIVIGGVKE
ncbi:carbohydrate ABC transporter permease [Litchfieldia alkalitelluris]|uniref:carbohydrate ABC transporter permease n=1 Tax=Litchfieldia alkalitelluris TaxID=304268 RepID=UPI000998225E|nr:carbohydrate ABC transporter permease [Litchfieldia alkalitelluris]